MTDPDLSKARPPGSIRGPKGTPKETVVTTGRDGPVFTLTVDAEDGGGRQRFNFTQPEWLTLIANMQHEVGK